MSDRKEPNPIPPGEERPKPPPRPPLPGGSTEGELVVALALGLYVIDCAVAAARDFSPPHPGRSFVSAREWVEELKRFADAQGGKP